MANEATLMVETHLPIAFTCADGAGIEKGTLLKLSDPFTVAATSAYNDVFIGIAAEEKINGDGKTKIGVYTDGIFKLVIAGGNTTTVGENCVIKGANTIGGYTTLDDEKGYVVGKALETGAAGESVLVLVRAS
jgi:hypothetical protein